jgi:hypothetical protein
MTNGRKARELHAVEQQQAQQPQVIGPQPVPMTFNVEGVRADDGTPMVMLATFSFTGTSVSFLPLEIARQVSAMIAAAADQVDTGLIVPRQPRILDGVAAEALRKGQQGS